MEYNNNNKPAKDDLLRQYLAEDNADAFGFVGTYGGTLALVTVLRIRLTPEVLGMVTGSVEESSDGVFWQVRLSKSAAIVDRLKEIGANVFPLGFSKEDIEAAFTAQGVDEKRKSRGKLFEDMTARALGWAQEKSQRADHKTTGDLVTPWGDRVQVKYYRAAFTVSK